MECEGKPVVSVRKCDIKIGVAGEKSHLVIDGQDISDKVVRYKLEHTAGLPPTLFVELAYPVNKVDVSGYVFVGDEDDE